ncbi:ISL3 family transposase [Streptomyces xinghaiensis]|uniref:ISL3 family transposase n=1 Tax=Streptomyces xinghaiensis TaxID=1038928 RepID=UPI0027B8AEBB|nr:ISL3 family transposase [Streptomyces xinghaiensis]
MWCWLWWRVVVCDVSLTTLLPHLAVVQVGEVVAGEGLLRVPARTCGDAVACPGCGVVSRRVHSRYVRHLDDCQVGGRPVVIDLSVRRWYCGNPGCPRVTFVEQVEGLTVRYQRRTPQLQRLLEAVALALAGRAGARLAARLHQTVSWTTLLHLVMRLADPQIAVPAVLGVDDFALRRGQVYGTVLVDCRTRRPVDVLPDREGATLAGWLARHPGVEVICRDRAEAYGEGAAAGAPQAVQVADRWHLWHNLVQAAERCVRRHQGCWKELGPDRSAGVVPTPAGQIRLAGRARPSGEPEGRYAERTRTQYAAVHQLRQQGYGIRASARRLGITPRRVRTLLRAATWQELVTGRWQGHRNRLDPFKEYLHRRWAEGQTNLVQLHAEIAALGYPGSYNSLCAYFRRFRQVKGCSPGPSAAPGIRDVTGFITRHPDTLDDEEKRQRKEVLTRCPDLQALSGHVDAFARMLTGLSAHKLPDWLTDVRQDDLPDLHSFARGIENDIDAVTAGLSLPWSSGVVEGHINRIKTLKRQMFNRAGFPLLRKRILLS